MLLYLFLLCVSTNIYAMEPVTQNTTCMDGSYIKIDDIKTLV